jgi:hypothetical protein
LLATLLRDTATIAQTGGGLAGALRDLQQHSPSPTLAMLAFNLRMYDTTGEDKFTRQIIDTASRVRVLFEGRQRARAYAASARRGVADVATAFRIPPRRTTNRVEARSRCW